MKKNLLLLLVLLVSGLQTQADVTIRFTAPATGWTARYVIVQANYPAYDGFGQEVVGGFGQTVYLSAGQSHDRTVGMRFVGANRVLTPTWKEDVGGSPANATTPASVNNPVDGATYAFTLGSVPVPNVFSTTNNTPDPRVFQYTDGVNTHVVTLQPGEILTVSTESAFTLSEITARLLGVGEFSSWGYVTNLVASHGGTTTGTAINIPAPPQNTIPTATNTPVFNAPANDTQIAANATANEIRQASSEQRDAMGALLAELKKLNAKDLATNAPFSMSVSNALYGRAVGVSNTASNGMVTAGSQASNDLNSVVAYMKQLDAAGPTAHTVQLGQASFTVDPLSGSLVSGLLAFINTAILWVAKLLLCVVIFKQTLHCWEGMAKTAAGTSTSGWLQNSFFSMPQLATTYAALAGRWAALAGAVALVGAVGMGILVGYGATFSLVGVQGASSVASKGMNYFLAIVPVDGLFSAFTGYFTTTIAMYGITMGSMAASDTTGKL